MDDSNVQYVNVVVQVDSDFVEEETLHLRGKTSWQWANAELSFQKFFLCWTKKAGEGRTNLHRIDLHLTET